MTFPRVPSSSSLSLDHNLLLLLLLNSPTACLLWVCVENMLKYLGHATETGRERERERRREGRTERQAMGERERRGETERDRIINRENDKNEKKRDKVTGK